MPKLYPIILSGGMGKRLWPLSRENFPKQFHALTGRDPMIIETARRLTGAGVAPPTVICANDHRFLTAAAFDQAGIEPLDIILEPTGRNTASAIAAAARHIHAIDPDGIIITLPSDHVIADGDEFARLIRHYADRAAANNAIMTIGIEPDRAETGYGYIQYGDGVGGDQVDGPLHQLTQFVEKPDRRTAETYLANGGYLWNAGIFMATADTVMMAMAQSAPDVAHAVQAAYQSAGRDLDFIRLGPEFGNAPGISFDHAVMEGLSDTDNPVSGLVLRADIGWADIGSWAGVWGMATCDNAGNATHGPVEALDTTNSYLRSDDDTLIAAIGVEDIITVVRDDVVLVADMAHAQSVKQVLANLSDDPAGSRYQTSPLRRQPWGYSKLIQSGPGFQAKEVMIKPGYQTAVQLHKQRSEHWVVLSGRASVMIDGQSRRLGMGQAVHIPPGTRHAIANEGDKKLTIFEVQAGKIKSDDIWRLKPAGEVADEKSGSRNIT
jgi:mannose-1-phosphate guanylyltransferase/mannose-6-phosphate isomerase